MVKRGQYSSKNLSSQNRLKNAIIAVIESLGLTRPHYSLGVVSATVDSNYVMVKLNGDTTAIKIKKSPDLTVAVGNGVLVINNINGSNTRFVISRTKI